MSKVHNFSAGPAILPREAMEAGARAVRDFNGMGLSILEISHRSKEFVGVMNEAIALVKELLAVPEGYSVLFLQGGASLQFAMAARSFARAGKSAAYLDTGSWSSKAIKEAKCFGSVNVVASSKDQNYSYIPQEYSVPADSSYFHITSNNTIFGTQLHRFPESPVPLIADMSSDIFSRPLPVEQFGLIYAGAQKNMGPSGVTMVIVRDSLLEDVSSDVPSMLDYRKHIAAESMYNTPPVFPVFMVAETLKWLKRFGGISQVMERNQQKSAKLYAEIDANPLFEGTARKEDRSQMNVTFVLKNQDLQADFLALANEAGLSGLKGHRSVGGFRASIYNAMGMDAVDALVGLMQDFAVRKG